MSGGQWGYKSHQIDELADEISSSEIVAFLRAVARTEHLIDWAESCDTSREDAERQVYDLWRDTFDELWNC